jgi:hypothetical protein
LWKSPRVLRPDELAAMRKEAERWMGVRYSMALNYLFCRKTIHCSELVARVLSVLPEFKGTWGEEYSRVAPVDVERKLLGKGWELYWTHTYK